ncbi:MAG: ShET2/EspL2 family type secretion system effector toxin [Solimicrobium sp.]|jgi:hypothetical protein|nr:ShET2/EspL2 family type secretion system effector toxin [Solimicrobium sp.]
MELGNVNCFLKSQTRIEQTNIAQTQQQVDLRPVYDLFVYILNASEHKGDDALCKYLELVGERNTCEKLLLDMATQSLNIQEEERGAYTTTVKDSNLNDIFLCVAEKDDKSISIQMGEEIGTISGLSFGQLQKELREIVVDHAHWYNGNISTLLVTSVKQRVSLDDLLQALLGQIASRPLSQTRQKALRKNYESMVEKILSICIKKQVCPVEITLPDDFKITVMKMEPDVIVEIGNCELTLNLFDLQTISYSAFNWQGSLYNKEYFSRKKVYDFDKSQPYLPMRPHEPPVALNGQAFITGTQHPIRCAELATQFIIDSLEEEGGNGKIDWALYNNRETIATRISSETIISYEALKTNALRWDLIDNDKFGEHLHACFEEMQTAEKKATFRTLLLESTNHAMAIRLHVKGSESRPLYVISFYEPHLTNRPARSELRDLSVLKSHTLELYITGTIKKQGDTRYNMYYPDNAFISTVMECDGISLTGKPSNASRKLSTFASDALTPTHIYFLLNYNFPKSFADLKNRLAGMSIDKVVELLTKIPDSGVNGLYVALESGYSESIRAYRELLQLIPINERDKLTEVLAARNEEGIPGLYMAVKHQHVDAIAAYGELFSLLPDIERAKLAKLIDAMVHGTPSLFMALQNGYTEVIRAYNGLLSHFLESEDGTLIRLIAAKDVNETPGLCMALQEGHVGAVIAYGELIFRVLKNKRSTLLTLITAKDGQGVPGIFIAFANGHTEAVKAYKELLQSLSESERIELFGLLTVMDANSTPWLYDKFENGDTDVIVMFKKYLELVSTWR